MEVIPILAVIISAVSGVVSIYGLQRGISKDRLSDLRKAIADMQAKLEHCEKSRTELESKVDYQGRRIDELHAENVRLMRDLLNLRGEK